MGFMCQTCMKKGEIPSFVSLNFSVVFSLYYPVKSSLNHTVKDFQEQYFSSSNESCSQCGLWIIQNNQVIVSEKTLLLIFKTCEQLKLNFSHLTSTV